MDVLGQLNSLGLALVHTNSGGKYHIARSAQETDPAKQPLLTALCGKQPPLRFAWIVNVPPTHVRYHDDHEVHKACLQAAVKLVNQDGYRRLREGGREPLTKG
jgi:hypothetical protein